MGFKRLLASMGAGGASVETELTEVNVVPGGIVQGEVRIQGGSVAQQIEGLNVGLQARVEVESGDQETKQDIEFTKQNLGGAFEVQATRCTWCRSAWRSRGRRRSRCSAASTCAG